MIDGSPCQYNHVCAFAQNAIDSDNERGIRTYVSVVISIKYNVHPKVLIKNNNLRMYKDT